MLDYLVTSRVRRQLLELLWGQQATGSVSELARRAGASFAGTHRELATMCASGLAVASRSRNQVLYACNPQHPQAALVQALVRPQPRAPDSAQDDVLRGWLRALGAPLTCAPVAGGPAATEVLALALRLAHRDATVTRVLPVVLWRLLASLDLDALVAAARRLDELQTLGFVLHLTGQLAGDRALVHRALGLRDHRRTRSRPFFAGVQGRHALAAARRHTPRVARQWGFVMNLGLDAFASHFEKYT